MLVVLIQN